MRISIIGSGYVGLCTAVGFASKGHEVICVDIDEEKVKKINNSETPIFEENLENMLKDAISKKLLYATTNINDAIINSDISFITVGTPSMLNGDMSLEYIKKASEDIGNTLEKKNSYHVIVVKSTVLPETTEKIIIPIIEKDSGKIVGRNFGICMNPEFL
ncbi:MAG TPA: 3-hydroxyacyl-CoA dehydrogenase NAD-binding domain-containing protein, partial [archaeon]|nr:3-hydroxyacyl-CoA dehydrogenase NAD-binding domain-containing protein [archaeon]